ncbi:sugar phosphate nucleotidyltransferase [Longirhabdus pacifica]|uniref:sugar phosphate nucleotidyltransferase n=1 Tax=Longirhabdus pacifica TaxID=2305227 RepID=UPI001008F152|nr:sugar phosphate nucleotidyltransferase [Longirhabdus pacifica]
MKGIILAGGTGSRLYPLTKVTNKHLLPVGKHPMIYYSVLKLKEAGIDQILIVTGKEHMGDVISYLGSGSDFDVSFTYKVQDAAGGIAQALGLAEGFVHEEKMVVILGDNIFSDSIVEYVRDFERQEQGAKLLLSEVPDPTRYGIAQLDGSHIVSVEEKPKHPKSPYAVTGIYMFDHQVFRIIKTLTPSARNEYEITDVNNVYIQSNLMTYDMLKGWWTDAGTHPSYVKANEWIRDEASKSHAEEVTS